MRELELKFQVHPEALRSLRQELARRGARPMRLIARYFDTPDGLLSSHRLSLRLRKEGRRWVQTLKGAGDSAVDRLEHNVVLRVPAGMQPALDIARHDGTDVGALLRDALGDAGAEALRERFATDVVRLACVLRWPGAEVEAALDLGSVRAGDRVAPICELELEHLSGDPGELFALARLWRAHGGLWLDTRSKAQRGATLALGLQHGGPVKSRTPVLTDRMDGQDLTRAVLRAVLDQVLGNAGELGAGSLDEAHLHQLRVGLRRLRTALRELVPLADGIDPAWEPALAVTFGRLGELRDDDTVARAVRPLLEQAGAPKLSWPARTGVGDAGAIVRDAAFQDTLLALLQWALLPAAAASACTPAQAKAQLTERLTRLHRQVSRGGKTFERLPTEQQHRLRKRLKRLRYLAEFAGTLWPDKAVQRYLRRLGPAQDELGRHNDVIVAGERFRADAARDPLSLFAAGFLQSHRAVTARQARVALLRAGGARRFWKG